jgi:hypothetical protein
MDNAKETLKEGDGPAVFYANRIQLSTSLYDIRIKFGIIDPAGGYTEDGILFLSPPHAKKFLEALANSVKQYETLYGTIPSGTIPVAIEK